MDSETNNVDFDRRPTAAEQKQFCMQSTQSSMENETLLDPNSEVSPTEFNRARNAGVIVAVYPL